MTIWHFLFSDLSPISSNAKAAEEISTAALLLSRRPCFSRRIRYVVIIECTISDITP
jgi:hypothetical protein